MQEGTRKNCTLCFISLMIVTTCLMGCGNQTGDRKLNQESTERATETYESESKISIGEDTVKKNETIRVYIVFDQAQQGEVTLEEQVTALEDVLPAEASFSIRRMDEEGYAVVASLSEAFYSNIEEASNVTSVSLSIPAEQTGTDTYDNKFETE